MEKLSPIQENPIKLWDAMDLKSLLDYKSNKSFFHLIETVVDTFNVIDVPYYENIIAIPPTQTRGKYNFHLSRFACYLLVCLADSKKESVEKLQTIIYREFKQYGITSKHIAAIDRFEVRNELADANKLLNKRAAQSNVKDYGSFYDAGYSGLYAMHAKDLHEYRNVPQEVNFNELMGRAELAANLLRLTLTEETIRVKNIRGQKNLEQTHFNVSNSIRKTVFNHVGIYPEQLHLYTHLEELNKALKEACQKMRKESDV